MQVRVGCEFQYEMAMPTPAVVQVQPHRVGDHTLLRETWETMPVIAAPTYHDLHGNTCRRLLLPAGPFTLRYDAICVVPDRFDDMDLDARPIGRDKDVRAGIRLSHGGRAPRMIRLEMGWKRKTGLLTFQTSSDVAGPPRWSFSATARRKVSRTGSTEIRS